MVFACTSGKNCKQWMRAGRAGRVAARVQARCLFTYVIRFTFKKIYGRDLLIVTRLLRWQF